MSPTFVASGYRSMTLSATPIRSDRAAWSAFSGALGRLRDPRADFSRLDRDLAEHARWRDVKAAEIEPRDRRLRAAEQGRPAFVVGAQGLLQECVDPGAISGRQDHGVEFLLIPIEEHEGVISTPYDPPAN